MNKTGISWTDFTWNPVSGCNKVSPGCQNCYAEAWSKRWKRSFDVTLHPEKLRQVKKIPSGSKVFVNSMSDLFHEKVPFEFIDEIMCVIRSRPDVVFQVLTKRPERAFDYYYSSFARNQVPENIWLGTSIEMQLYLPRLIPLRLIPAKIHFISAEPLLEPIDLNLLSGYYPHGITKTERGVFIPSSTDGVDRSASRWVDLESGRENERQMAQSGKNKTSCTTSHRCISWGGLPHGKNNDRWEASINSGSSIGLASDQWADTSRIDDKPQEWHQNRQQAREFGIGDLFRADKTHDTRIEEGESIGSKGREKFYGENIRQCSAGNKTKEKMWGEFEIDCQRLWDILSTRVEDLQRSKKVVDFLIIGGESGPKHRPMNIEWARNLIRQAKEQGVAVWMKQLGGFRPGGDIEDFPEDLRLREFPHDLTKEVKS